MSRLPSETQALLDAGRSAFRPSGADRTRIHEALQARMVAPSGVGESGPSLSPAAPAGFGWPSIALVAVGLGVGGGLLFQAFGSKQAQAPAVVADVSPPASTAAAPVTPVAPPAAVENTSAIAPAPTEARSAAPRRASDSLAEEVAILSRAEKELHAGRFSSALRVLDEHANKFPRGALAQERVAARIHALCGAGRVSEADAALARLSPGSLHEGRAREACATSVQK